MRHKPNTRQIFILTSATDLPDVASFVKTITQPQSYILFVRSNVDPTFLPQIFERANLHSFDRAIVYSNLDISKRVLADWEAGSQEQLIATATVIDEHLLVTDGNLKNWEIPFDSLPALASIPIEQRAKFEIDEDGSYLY